MNLREITSRLLLGCLFASFFSALFATTGLCSASHLLVLKTDVAEDEPVAHIGLAARFYGVPIRYISTAESLNRVKDEFMDPGTLGIVISANALSNFRRTEFMHWLTTRSGRPLPVLIAGLSANLDPATAKEWTRGYVHCVRVAGLSSQASVLIRRIEGVTAELSDATLPTFSAERDGLEIITGAPVRPVVEVVDGARHAALLAEDPSETSPIFFLAQTPGGSLPPSKSMSYLPLVFSQWAAPYLMYVRLASGDLAWHFPRQFANFTVDDPWLVEPYGLMSYSGLLQEMQAHNFHTTIAFIPWNFDRSHSDVVSLIRNHPERFSICVHGDDHSHAEFSLTSPGASFSDEQRQRDSYRIRQARARMDEFTQVTKIPYDRVWVFPHVIGPQPVLGLLKQNGFLATTNAEAVPYAASPPDDPLFRFRNVTLAFDNFPSIRRYFADPALESQYLAIQAFLTNPIVLYGHQDFFAPGIGAFDPYADHVNQLNPQVTWTSLGDIAQQSYLIRNRNDGQFDVEAFSGEILLTNSSNRAHRFFVSAKVFSGVTKDKVTVDGHSITIDKTDPVFSVDIPAGETRRIVTDDEVLRDADPVDTSRKDLRSSVLRYISDFRDLYLARSNFGRSLTDFYYAKIDPETVGRSARLYAFLGVLAAITIGAGLLFRSIWRRGSVTNSQSEK